MTRQEFSQREQVMVHESYDQWKPAVVVEADIPKQEYRYSESSRGTATVHDVRVWTETRWYRSRRGGPIPHFAVDSFTVRNSRSAVLSVAEYEATVGVEKARKAAEREEANRQREADHEEVVTINGVHVTMGQLSEVCGRVTMHNKNRRMAVHELARLIGTADR